MPKDTMTATCWTCSHSALRDRDDADRDKSLMRMARHGTVNCTRSICRSVFYAFDTPACPQHAPLTAETQSARDKWRANADAHPSR
jgi:hypothetical protein